MTDDGDAGRTAALREVYPYNKHEGGGSLHQQRKLQWLREVLG